MAKKRLSKVEIQQRIDELKNKGELTENEKIDLEDLKIKLKIENLKERKARLAERERKIDTHQKCVLAGEIYRLYKQQTGKNLIELSCTDDQVKKTAHNLYERAVQSVKQQHNNNNQR